MLAGVCVGSNDLFHSGEFYDCVLAVIGMHRAAQNDHEIGYADRAGSIVFWVLTPYDKNPATFGNGSQIMFRARNQTEVDKFYQTAIENGGSDEGAPGPRDYHAGYYGAYCRDPDDNKLHVFIRP